MIHSSVRMYMYVDNEFLYYSRIKGRKPARSALSQTILGSIRPEDVNPRKKRRLLQCVGQPPRSIKGVKG